MVEIQADQILTVGTAMLAALGVPQRDAVLVATELVTAHRMGLHSHGVIRFAQYARDIRSGRIVPGAQVSVDQETTSTAIVNGADNLGQVTAYRATDIAVEKSAAAGLACVATRRCNHVGRLGSYVEHAARSGVVAVAVAAIPVIGHFVVPWGGTAGRLGTNPFAYAFPTTGEPIVADFATSVIPEGRVRAARNGSTTLPSGAVVDAAGRPTTDPHAFYGPPMGGLLPFGGDVGYKGYALGVLVELLGATLLGDLAEAPDRGVNGMTVLAIDPARFGGRTAVAQAASHLVGYLHSSPPAPGIDRVLVPGERESRALAATRDAARLTVDVGTWAEFQEIAQGLGIALPDVAG